MAVFHAPCLIYWRKPGIQSEQLFCSSRYTSTKQKLHGCSHRV